jgi:hypothetical protein
MPEKTPNPETPQPIGPQAAGVKTLKTDQLQPDETVKKDEIAKETKASSDGRSKSSSPTSVNALRVTPPPAKPDADNDPQTHAPLEIDDWEEVPYFLCLDSQLI